ncbi:MAG: alpha/beta hydrolase family protein [Gammaproteobacteria bacterium]
MKKETHSVKVDGKLSISSVWLIPERYDAALIIAHGAGNDMHSDFISYLHREIAERDILTVKFNFPYKEQGKKAPDRAPVLEATWWAVIETVLEKTGLPQEKLFLSGKSMGGRYASLIASQKEGFGGLILYGYPLHAPGKKDKPRIEHLAAIRCPMLFFQGTRDSLCDLESLKAALAQLNPAPDLQVIEGGDHSFKVLKKFNRTEEDVLSEVAEGSAGWINRH